MKKQLHFADWIVIGIYLAVILGVATFFYYWQKKKKMSGTNNFFTGGGRNPAWVVGFSMWATILSSLFFISAAGNSFDTRWMWAGTNIALISITPFIAIFVIPFYRRMRESTAYSYLQTRFNYAIRAINSGSFIFFQIFRVAIVLYAPTLALSVVVDIPSEVILVIIGLSVIVTTMFGGFKAVIWSDAIQGMVLLVGSVLVIIFGLAYTNFSASTIKFQTPLELRDWQIGIAGGGISILFAYNIVNSLYVFMGSQDVTQRYKGTKSIGEIRKTLYITSALGIATVLIFFGGGAVLYTYYSSIPETASAVQAGTNASGIVEIVGGLPAKTGNLSQLLPIFVVNTFPIGLVGLVFASIFAASQSTISSGLSAIANSIIVDFVQPFNRGKINDKKMTLISRGIVLFFGLLAIGAGILLIKTKQDKLFDYFTGIVGLLNAPTVAVFLLGIFTVRTNSYGALIGTIISFVIAIPIWALTQNFVPQISRISFPGVYLLFVNLFITLFLSYTISIFMDKIGIVDKKRKSLTNVTYWTTTFEFKRLVNLEVNLHKVDKLFKKGKVDEQFQQNYYNKVNKLIEVVNGQF